MINLTQDKENIIFLTLFEKQTLESPYFLFEFENDLNNKKFYFNTEDISTVQCCRYNKFIVNVTGGTENLSGGTIKLRNGSYTYNVYEASAQTLSYSSTTMLSLETGKVIVEGTENINSIYQ